MTNVIVQKYSAHQIQFLIEYKNRGYTSTQIHLALNKEFSINRTKSSVVKKLYELFKLSFTVEIDKVIIQEVRSGHDLPVWKNKSLCLKVARYFQTQ